MFSLKWLCYVLGPWACQEWCKRIALNHNKTHPWLRGVTGGHIFSPSSFLQIKSGPSTESPDHFHLQWSLPRPDGAIYDITGSGGMEYGVYGWLYGSH